MIKVTVVSWPLTDEINTQKKEKNLNKAQTLHYKSWYIVIQNRMKTIIKKKWKGSKLVTLELNKFQSFGPSILIELALMLVRCYVKCKLELCLV